MKLISRRVRVTGGEVVIEGVRVVIYWRICCSWVKELWVVVGVLRWEEGEQ